MRKIKVYCRPGETPLLVAFLNSLPSRFAEKILWQIMRLADTPVTLMREPHVKRFTIERYHELFELREKSKVLVRIIFTIQNGDIILLVPFIKKHPRDTMQALESSLKMLTTARDDPAYVVNLCELKEGLVLLQAL